MSSLPESIANGRYVVERELGRGGKGVVYKALDTTLHREVAIKIVGLSVKADAMRFQTEARAAGRLKHANTTSVLDFGQTETGDLYLVMEYIDGQNLSEWIEESGKLPPDMVIDIFSRVLLGLAHAHEKGLVHRDIKPSNIMMAERPEGGFEPKITDFGLSRMVDEDQSLTSTGVAIGSPNYVSPEQARGMISDERSDIYSIGCSMFKALSGRSVFEEEDAVNTLLKHVSEPAPLLRSISEAKDTPRDLEKIVARCLEKDPAKRFQSALELRAALAPLQDNETVGQEIEQGGASRPRSNRWIKIASFVSVVAVLAAYFGWQMTRSVDTGIEKALEPVPLNTTPGFADSEMFSRGADVFETSRERSVESSQAFRGSHLVSTSHVIVDPKSAENTPSNCRSVKLTAATVECIKPLANKPNVLYIDASKMELSSDAMKALATVKQLEEFKMGGGKALSGASMKDLAGMPRLRSLCLDNTPISNAGLRMLSQSKSLERIQLNRCIYVNDESLKIVAAMPKLQALEVAGTAITNEGLKVLSKRAKSLCSIYLNETDITDEGVASLIRNDMRSVHLAGCRKVTATVLDHLAGMKHLERLDLRGLPLNDAHAESLARLSSLRRLDLRRTRIMENGLSMLTKLNKMVLLLIGGTRVNPERLSALSAFPHLQGLDVSSLSVDDRGFARLAKLKLKMFSSAFNNGTATGIENFIENCPTIKIVIASNAQQQEILNRRVESDAPLRATVFASNFYDALDVDLPFGFDDEPFKPDFSEKELPQQ